MITRDQLNTSGNLHDDCIAHAIAFALIIVILVNLAKLSGHRYRGGGTSKLAA
jgi:hypothetical protein